jgi:hypothetical protein
MLRGMSDPIDYNPSKAQMIDPVPEKVARVEVEEATCWSGWAYDAAQGYGFDPIAMFTDQAMAHAFHEFRKSEHCPEEFRTNMDAAIMVCHVPQIIVANHSDDSEAAEVMAKLCDVGADAWVEETSDEAAGE